MNRSEPPVVFCHGLFGWGHDELGGYPYFFCAERLQKKATDGMPRFIYPSTGPVSSLHDQACELFYQLKGGRVNYGADHSKKFSHARYSRDYTGKAMYADWSENNPLDFVAHSMGAPVVRMLQYLLESGFFSQEDGIDYGTSSRWIRSLTTVAGVHNGSTLTWILGADENSGLVAKNAILVKFLARILDRYARAQTRHGKLSKWYDLHLEQWGIASGSSMTESVRNLFEVPSFVESEDWALYDLTPNAMEKWNTVLIEYPQTWYFSYVTRTTFSFFGLLDLPYPVFTHWFLLPFAFLLGRFRCKTERWKGRIDHRWFANDGMCPSWSQDAPKLGRKAPVRRFRKGMNIEEGTWIVMKKLQKTDHAEIAMLPHLWRLRSDEKIYLKILTTISGKGTTHE